MSAAEVISFGCRLNIVESEAIRALTSDQPDLVVINSCGVTTEAVAQARKAIRRARRDRPDARIIVTGCAAQIDPGEFARMPEVSRVLGNADKFKRESFVFPENAGSPKVRVSDIMTIRENAPHLVSAFDGHSRAFVEIQNGCDHRCTFCAIPFGRGNSRSVPADLVVGQIGALVERGYREVVLTGVDITSYGADLPEPLSLGLLVEQILGEVPHLPRLRLSSLDSVEIDDRLFEIVTGDDRLMPHLHLSLQAGDDMILKRMKRRHSRAQAIRMVERLKASRPEIAIGADLIAGFPTEDDAMAANSLDLIERCDIVFGHIFPYSPRRGTPAARMPQVPTPVIKARASALRAAAERRRAAWLASLVGTTQQVLVERGGGGHAGNFARVRIDQPEEGACVGSILSVRIISASDAILTGVPA